ncbi:MAG: hypothetical protein LC792_24200 [Actinobacteria bacterium]|nr:hypothetical protein [Actinomycetota bacterium]
MKPASQIARHSSCVPCPAPSTGSIAAVPLGEPEPAVYDGWRRKIPSASA